MANKTRWIKSRIKSVNETKKITRAMYLISASKMKRSRDRLDSTRPYFEKINEFMKDLVVHGMQTNHILFEGSYKEGQKRLGVIVISGDKGLCGGYNANVIRSTLNLYENLSNKGEVIFFPIGTVGKNFLSRHGYKVEDNFNYQTQSVSVKVAKGIAQNVVKKYYRGDIHELYIIYTKLISTIKQDVVVKKLLPLDPSEFVSGEFKKDETIRYEPSPTNVLDVVIYEYLKGIIFGAMMDSYVSELAARMTAMDNATKSADEMIQKLVLKLNRERQAVITQEISEIISGAAALK
ncbi:ATP synthase F1, gamma subunit [Caldicellulosiruptor saccharolyticus DSM 8903]|uniref:ATP synthase gamma chain n=1 Tax=Caldicellulosiruptor saccharolyticus (strain ATCC 43494 / DSM 8903 / Tp8T 6331) TaxID=351627 RepID=ATPG_CALS8|nr:ATP synthase F1 subunit gamma [Caldicellulosiruptor saccharolyticus]A4XKX1.1 RecName: Full=ATP synthase gamma chain; AltName: Full=ATP synthase F1 sector gamma subunit; AltName: Full=F-ATPase gamma subunit [Caldicellulosiruptor saccharolyticus DSM 8903]ABP67556.1 ATP synthase F1, gamma subunit [Caldicellulosiruptor saccharolyticus DSM 8903]